MPVARITEINSTSKKSLEDAIEEGVRRANKTLDNVKGAWIQDIKVDVDDGNIVQWRVFMKVTFILRD